MEAIRTLRLLLCSAALTLGSACTDGQERQHEMQVAEPDPQLDPTREAVREPIRPDIEPPPEHRRPLEIHDDQPPGYDERQQSRERVDDPRAAEGPPHTPTDRPEGIDPTTDPMLDPLGDPEPEPVRRQER
jgi:hypothetical protein